MANFWITGVYAIYIITVPRRSTDSGLRGKWGGGIDEEGYRAVNTLDYKIPMVTFTPVV